MGTGQHSTTKHGPQLPSTAPQWHGLADRGLSAPIFKLFHMQKRDGEDLAKPTEVIILEREEWLLQHGALQVGFFSNNFCHLGNRVAFSIAD